MLRIDRVCLTTLAAGLLCLGLLTASQAAPADRNACSDDIARFCKNVEGDPIATVACLEDHESELSPACKEYEAKLEGRRGEAREDAKLRMRFRHDCGVDIDKYCKGVDPAQQGLVKCIREHKTGLSPSCSAWLKAVSAE